MKVGGADLIPAPVDAGLMYRVQRGLKCRLYTILCERAQVSGVLCWQFSPNINRVSRLNRQPLTHPRSIHLVPLKYCPTAVCLIPANASTSSSSFFLGQTHTQIHRERGCMCVCVCTLKKFKLQSACQKPRHSNACKHTHTFC